MSSLQIYVWPQAFHQGMVW